MDGFLLLNKSKGSVSFDLVRQVKKILKEKHVGHSGTLDPLASGLMILALGKATRFLEYFLGLDKEYEVWAEFGYKSDTYDSDGNIESVKPDFEIDRSLLENFLLNFTGKITQIPPKYSAKKIKGERACDIMRKGGDVVMKLQNIEVYKFKIVEYQWPRVKFCIACSSGTYVRSLVNDLGVLVGTGAYVTGLERTSIKDFLLEEALTIENDQSVLLKAVKSLDDIARRFEYEDLNEFDFASIKRGTPLTNIKHEGVVLKDKSILMAFYNGKFVGVLEKKFNEHFYRLKKSFI